MRNAGKIMIVAVVATALAACSPSREEPSDLPPGEQPTHTPAPASVSASPSPAHQGEQARECTAEDVTVNLAGEQPQVEIPRDCAAPATALTRDLAPGSGTAAAAGSTIELNYEVVAWSTGQVADSTFGPGQPVSVELGTTQEIEGLSEGLTGIRQGGTRLLVLPPDLGYNPQDGNPHAGDSLVVVAEAVQVTTA
ncbi:FKBP-type peptidyl-prolyl cis-trans isomerase [Saccharomonospora sp. NPDC046836]|uniref:FKBP-type peptidyl-prolyl cis-trans isomerase n=1 Tax=Saccharomonospora sp. NPDC046836 TaxID=3156921 RepID=UPI0033DAC0E8